jgi:gliding motility-associated-like protein
MTNKVNIDELLKQELNHLAPEVPDGAWDGINTQMDVLNAAAQATGVGAKTSTILSTKIIISVAAAIVTAVGVITYVSVTDKAANPEVKNNPVVIEEVENDAEETVLVRNTEPQPKAESTLTISEKKSAHQSKSAVQKPASYPSDQRVENNAHHVIKESSTQAPESKFVDQENNNTIPSSAPVSTQEVVNELADKDERQQDEETIDFVWPSIPNVITPNADGLNDEFVIKIENEMLYDLKITDKTGNILFESKDKKLTWNGLNPITNQPYESGVYVFAFKYQLKGMKEPKYEKGFIQLITNK